MNSLSFVQGMFRRYYAEKFPADVSMPLIDKREFGFLSFESQMIRHKSFQNIEELKIFMKNFVPSDVYYSCAYYENPTAEMERKNWLGADLIFDIDADHIPTRCERIHDKWVCCNCGFSGKGITPERCPLCGSEKLNAETWPCETCLESARFETMKLLDILQEDFGFSKNEIRIFFSGHRGYHIHVENEAIRSLDSIARKEIVDYISGIGLEAPIDSISKRGLNKRNVWSDQFFSYGWPKRLREGLQTFLMDVKEYDLKKLGFRREIANAIMREKNMLMKNLSNSVAWYTTRGIGFKTIAKLFEHVLAMKSVKIDTVVTTDVHRLIRMPETLNSKTGFKKTEVPIVEIEDFDPFKDAIAFKNGETEVRALDAPNFRVGDEVFGPYKDKKVKLPVAAALLLVCRGRAEVTEIV